MSVLANIHDFKAVSFDVETTGLEWHKHDKVFGVAVAGWDGKSVISEYFDVREKPRVIEFLKREAPHIKAPVVNHNIKFDVHMLLNEGIKLPMDLLECTSVRAALLNEHERSFSLDALCLKYLNEGKVDIWEKLAQLFGGAPSRVAQIKNLHRAPSKLAATYAAPDPALALKLWLHQKDGIEKQGLQKVWGLEKALLPVLVDMERFGVRVDVQRAKKSLKEMDVVIDKAKHALYKLVGPDFNAGSPKQMRELFKPVKGEDDNWRIGDVLLEKTDGGQPSINKDALMELARRGNRIAGAIVDARKFMKAQQFLSGHILGFEHNGRVYPNYNQTRGENEHGTSTGRFSINDPALQQMPKRDEDIAAIVRSCFIPEKGHDWCCADWEQFEFRWFGHYVKDPQIIEAYRRDPKTDYHQIVSDLTGIPRKPRYAGDANSKQINLGLVFGMGQGKLAQEMGLPYTVHTRKERDGTVREFLLPGEEAVAIFEKYHSAIPGVQALLSKASSIARSRGYVKTQMERHIRFPHGKFTHKAGGLVFQGTSADCMKQKMVELHPIAKREGFHILLSVHDELDASMPKKESRRMAAIMKEKLELFDGEECPIRCDIPILSSVNLGPNWWEACK